MESIRVRNLRSIADSTTIAIKPISVLVGANSSGKSTFLRTFPLVKQSQEMRTLGGLALNEGDVNFGLFNEALRKDASPAELRLEFGFTVESDLPVPSSDIVISSSTMVICELTFNESDKDARYPRLRAVKFKIHASDTPDEIDIQSSHSGEVSHLTVNGLRMSDEAKDLKLLVNRGLVPRLARALDTEDEERSLFQVDEAGTSSLERVLLQKTDPYFHGRTGEETRLEMFNGITIASPQRMFAELRKKGSQTWNERTRHWTPETAKFNEIRNLLIAKSANKILNVVSAYVTQLARSTYYFAPVRAQVDRDYQSRDVSAVSVDPRGVNVAMVLAGMSLPELSGFRKWLKERFRFEVFPKSVHDGARIALRMLDAATGTEFNLADTGFGYSQMLPFLVQIWNLTDGIGYRRPMQRFGPRYYTHAPSSTPLICIEQPELHLHPALQARLAELIVDVARISQERRVHIRFVLETHSPVIIERMGQLIEAQRIGTDDIQIVLFEPDSSSPASNTSVVRATQFDSDGVLKNWPFGFLAAPLP
jgi:hypothetical protein